MARTIIENNESEIQTTGTAIEDNVPNLGESNTLRFGANGKYRIRIISLKKMMASKHHLKCQI